MSQVTGTYPDPEALAALLGGELRRPAPIPPIRGVAIDSRRVQPGDLFFALRGRHADGHSFLDAALAAGASLVVMGRCWPLPAGPSLAVEEPLAALQKLAAG